MNLTTNAALVSKWIPEWIILYSFFRASQNKELRPGLRAAGLGLLVAPTGFEPATSALRVRKYGQPSVTIQHHLRRSD